MKPGEITKEQVEKMKKRMFNKDYIARDDEALGIAISQYLNWDGAAILRTVCAALEDANFHTEVEEITEKYPWAFWGGKI